MTWTGAYIHGPTPHLAWKLATLAKQAMARKLKNIWEVWNMMAGFEMIICGRASQTESRERRGQRPQAIRPITAARRGGGPACQTGPWRQPTIT